MNNEAKGQHVISLRPQAIWFKCIWSWGLDNYGHLQKIWLYILQLVLTVINWRDVYGTHDARITTHLSLLENSSQMEHIIDDVSRNGNLFQYCIIWQSMFCKQNEAKSETTLMSIVTDWPAQIVKGSVTFKEYLLRMLVNYKVLVVWEGWWGLHMESAKRIVDGDWYNEGSRVIKVLFE